MQFRRLQGTPPHLRAVLTEARANPPEGFTVTPPLAPEILAATGCSAEDLLDLETSHDGLRIAVQLLVTDLQGLTLNRLAALGGHELPADAATAVVSRLFTTLLYPAFERESGLSLVMWRDGDEIVYSHRS